MPLLTIGELALIAPEIRVYRRPGVSIEVYPDARRHPCLNCGASGLQMEVIIQGRIIDAVEERILVRNDPGGGDARRRRFYFPQATGEVYGKTVIALTAHGNLIVHGSVPAPENAVIESRLQVPRDCLRSLP